MEERGTVVGTVEGTGSAINITLGFQPAAVQLKNIDGLCTLDWTENMPDASGLKTVTAGDISKITTKGITPLAPTTSNENEGFTIGTDTDINVSGETIEYIAFR